MMPDTTAEWLLILILGSVCAISLGLMWQVLVVRRTARQINAWQRQEILNLESLKLCLEEDSGDYGKAGSRELEDVKNRLTVLSQEVVKS